MTDLQTALVQVGEIEAAVAAGDLELANSAAQSLKPLLVSEHVDDLLVLRARLEALTIGVRELRAQDLSALKKVKQQRGGAAAYEQMQNRT